MIEGARTSPGPSFRPDVEGLRAVAVVLVVLNHLCGWPRGGYLGVDVFFVVSGFVITQLLWHGARRGRPAFREFYLRRVRRLLPSAVLVLVVTNLAVQVLFFGPRVGVTREDSWWALGFLANVRMAQTGTDYFHATDAPSVVQHYWSLAVEEQFYLVWPLLLLGLVVLARRRRSDVTRVTWVLMLASLGYAVWLVRAHPTEAYFSTPARAWELGVGAVVALGLAGRGRIGRRAGELLSWAGAGLLVVGVLTLSSGSRVPGLAALAPVVGTGLLVFGGSAQGTPTLARALSRPAPRYVGRISYPLYLWHWPVVTITRDVWGTGTLVLVDALLVAVTLAVLTHHLVEEPLRGHRPVREAYRAVLAPWRGRSLVPVAQGAVATLAVVAAVAAGASFRAPATGDEATAATPSSARGASAQQLSREVRAGLALSEWGSFQAPEGGPNELGVPEWTEDGCLHVQEADLARCRYGPAKARRHALLLGDSIAISWMPALRAALEPRGYDIQSLTLGECGNALTPVRGGAYFAACDAHRNWVVEQVRTSKPDLVVLSNVARTDWLPPEVRAAAEAHWERGLTGLLREVVPAATSVVVLGPPPGAGNPQTCLRRFGSPQDCTRGVPAVWDLVRRAEKRAASRTGARYVDPSAWFCWQRSCPVLVGGRAVYVDDRHLSPQYSSYLSRVVREAVLGRSRG